MDAVQFASGEFLRGGAGEAGDEDRFRPVGVGCALDQFDGAGGLARSWLWGAEDRRGFTTHDARPQAPLCHADAPFTSAHRFSDRFRCFSGL